MDCKEALQLLPAYHDKQLKRGIRAKLRAHLKTCPNCATSYEAYKKLPGLIEDVSTSHLPESLRERIIAKAIQPPQEQADMLSEKFKTFSLRKVMILGSIITLITAAAGVAFLIVLDDYIAAINIKSVLSSKSQMKQGIESSEDPSVPQLRRLKYLPQPEVKLGGRNYQKGDLEKVAIQPVVIRFAQEYRILEATAYQKATITDVVDLVSSNPERTVTLPRAIDRALASIKYPALPSYVEEAHIDGIKSWVVVVNWESGRPAQRLSRIAVFAIDSTSAKVIDVWPSTPLGQNIDVAGANPHVDLSCMHCHPDFDDPNIRLYDWKATAEHACASCHHHKKQYAIYKKSIHGKLHEAGIPGKGRQRAATCTDCHSGHTTLQVKKEFRDRLTMRAQAKTFCGRCHEDYWESYNDYYHGKAYKSKAPDAPVCWDCHGFHDIQPSSNPRSKVSKAKIKETCRKCHEGTDERFTQYTKLVHGHQEELQTNAAWRFLTERLTAIKQVLTRDK